MFFYLFTHIFIFLWGEGVGWLVGSGRSRSWFGGGGALRDGKQDERLWPFCIPRFLLCMIMASCYATKSSFFIERDLSMLVVFFPFFPCFPADLELYGDVRGMMVGRGCVHGHLMRRTLGEGS